MVSAGVLNHPIEILKVTVSRNEYGEQVDSYDTLIKTRAKILNLSANRQSINNETFYDDVKQITVRYYVKVDEFDHICIDGKEYEINALIPDKENNQKIINISLINK